MEQSFPTAERVGNFWHYSDGTILPVITGGDGDEPIVPAAGDAPAGDAPAPADVTPPVAPVEGAPTEPAAVEAVVPPVAAEPIVVADLPADLAVAEETSLRELFAALDAQLHELQPRAATADDVVALETIIERQRAIAGEIERRNADVAERRARLTAIETAQPVVLPGAVPVLASAAAVVAGRGVQPPAAQAPDVPAVTRPRVAMVASVGTNAVGTEVDTQQLGRLVDTAKSGREGKVILAALPPYDIDPGGLPELLSADNSTRRNDALIREAVEDWRELRHGRLPVRTAAICEPLDIIRDIPSAFTAEERIASIFPSRPAGRGGFQFTPSMVLSAMAAGAGEWTEATQAAVDVTDPATWKPIIDVTCPTAQPAVLRWVTAALRFDNTTEMSNPERIANALAALMALKARLKDARLLQLIDSLSHHYTFGLNYGAVPTLIRAINTALAQGRYADRLEEAGYTVILPPGVVAALLNDRAGKGYNDEDVDPGDGPGELLTYIQNNVEGVDRVVASLDASAAGEPGVPFTALNAVGAAATELPVIGATYRIRLVEPSAAIYAETGEINTGVQRSPELMLQNKAQMFAEQGFLLAKHGPQPWFALDVELCDNGARAGLVDPFDCPQAS